MGSMLPYIAAPWIRHGIYWEESSSQSDELIFFTVETTNQQVSDTLIWGFPNGWGYSQVWMVDFMEHPSING